MLALAKLFLALGDHFPAYGSAIVLEFVPGQSHHDLASVYHVMSKVVENPLFQGAPGVGGHGERTRLELNYYFRARDKKAWR